MGSMRNVVFRDFYDRLVHVAGTVDAKSDIGLTRCNQVVSLGEAFARGAWRVKTTEAHATCLVCVGHSRIACVTPP